MPTGKKTINSYNAVLTLPAGRQHSTESFGMSGMMTAQDFSMTFLSMSEPL